MTNNKKAVPAAGTGTASNNAFDKSNNSTNDKRIIEWLNRQTQPGAKCGNCQKPFTAARKPRAIVGSTAYGPKGEWVRSLHVLCGACRSLYIEKGESGIVNARKDARLAAITLMSQSGGTA